MVDERNIRIENKKNIVDTIVNWSCIKMVYVSAINTKWSDLYKISLGWIWTPCVTNLSLSFYLRVSQRRYSYIAFTIFWEPVVSQNIVNAIQSFNLLNFLLYWYLGNGRKEADLPRLNIFARARFYVNDNSRNPSVILKLILFGSITSIIYFFRFVYSWKQLMQFSGLKTN